MYQLYLASESPRRQELLNRAGISFLLFPVKISETFNKNLTPTEIVEFLSRMKSEAARGGLARLNKTKTLLLTADTLVFLEGEPLGKPSGAQEATRMLSALSGRGHEVITGFCVYNFDTSEEFIGHARTEVVFRPLSELEIADYVRTNEPLDKAGAYAIQGLGGSFVEKFVGSRDNVVGLPVEEILSGLQVRGWNVRPSKK